MNPVNLIPKPLPDITLRHAISRETRVLPVLMALPHWKLLIRWGMAGLYTYDAARGCLLLGRRSWPWQDPEPPMVRRVWHQMVYPGRLLPDPPFDPLTEKTEKKTA